MYLYVCTYTYRVSQKVSVFELMKRETQSKYDLEISCLYSERANLDFDISLVHFRALLTVLMKF